MTEEIDKQTSEAVKYGKKIERLNKKISKLEKHVPEEIRNSEYLGSDDNQDGEAINFDHSVSGGGQYNEDLPYSQMERFPYIPQQQLGENLEPIPEKPG